MRLQPSGPAKGELSSLHLLCPGRRFGNVSAVCACADAKKSRRARMPLVLARLPHRPSASYPTPVERGRRGICGSSATTSRARSTAATRSGSSSCCSARAREAGKTRILTVGAVGSHQVVATALYGAREGFAVDAVLVPQPASPHARAEPARRARARAARDRRVRRGASRPRTSRRAGAAMRTSFRSAARMRSARSASSTRRRSSRRRCARAQLPEPDVVGGRAGLGGHGGGSRGGLRAGGAAHARARRRGRAADAGARAISRGGSRRRPRRSPACRSPSALRAAKRIDVEGQWIGRGYGHPTEEGERPRRSRVGVGLDARPDVHREGVRVRARPGARAESAGEVLYWHTLSTAPLDAPRSATRSWSCRAPSRACCADPCDARRCNPYEEQHALYITARSELGSRVVRSACSVKRGSGPEG